MSQKLFAAFGVISLVVVTMGVAGGIAIGKANSRLEQMYGHSHTFSLSSAPGAGTRIDIRLPLLPATHLRPA